MVVCTRSRIRRSRANRFRFSARRTAALTGVGLPECCLSATAAAGADADLPASSSVASARVANRAATAAAARSASNNRCRSRCSSSRRPASTIRGTRFGAGAAGDSSAGSVAGDAMSALENLGYGRAEAHAAIGRARSEGADGDDLSALIAAALQQLGRGTRPILRRRANVARCGELRRAERTAERRGP